MYDIRNTEAEDTVALTVRTLQDLCLRLGPIRDEPTVDGLLDALRATRDLHAAEERLAAATVGMLRHLETSWLEIASALGITRQAAWDRYRASEGELSPADAGLLAAVDRASRGREASLERGRVYTRVELQRLFSIRDATLKNGVFMFKPRREIWLFVTEDKQPDRVQFEDRLTGDELRWQGQLSGRTDRLIQNHRADGNRILLFYRQSKNEHPGAGFRLEGEFEYVSSTPGKPTTFILKRAA